MRLEKWHSSIPTNCDLCGRKIENEFIDGKTVRGPWGILCPRCHKAAGVGLGVGRGQQYLLSNVNGEDTFLCISGGRKRKEALIETGEALWNKRAFSFGE